MRVVYIHQHFNFPWEPGWQRPWQFARRLVAAGHEVTVICGGRESARHQMEGVDVKRLAVPYENAMVFQQRVRSFVSFMARASWAAAAVDADVVFASSTPLTTAVPGIIASKCRRAPFVFEVRDLWPEAPVALGFLKSRPAIRAAEALEKFAYRSAKHVIALSPGMEAGVKRVWPRAATTVVPNASDVENFAPARADREQIRADLGWAEDETVLFYAGSFGVTYDVPWLIRLAGELKGRSQKFRVVAYGEGAATADCRRTAREYGFAPLEILPGKIPRTEIERMLPAADFAVSTLVDNPALEINSLNKVFDALAAARPVLFNHAGWLPEVLSAAGAGWQLSRDPATAAEQLVGKLSSGEINMAAASAAALELAQQEFDRDLLFERFRQVLEAAAGLSSKHITTTPA
ncbi:glycosyltransferase family 4 protein [Nesterenkonia alkaliphila]|uniref:D-inositol 3-phosphate glycosyltransferase n=1 Tax=Nesterenkonia alkaliphila TaxID=1463631 RepID=A0A7K1UFW8_9MICC|nr:glycosyltransferase family 4 protein [Nesterenkonia alkaliphila]MVT25358.1 glycosyltransferase [Nesterenkonia alkaliphila]GFZ94310.1 glycosyltransferase WbuB [Nesterenkonia alkaliphila]